ncbi:inorganic diphosphatase [Halanaerobium sp. Z-7514]|uniref:Inorganic pyrophosphatase n=1 Tax=Halanaerobium polyolivorans TaxID=2886943 RepID=A0AAW4X1T9_9FIRM|nr:inorganic diphosphatase [Halanaerobium polyolivorans]MCC3145807.1 inorganic diphosphatase [Halanaerobium polyolivorans]
MSKNLIDVLIEIPKGSNNKYEYDKEKGAFRLDRVMFSPVYYPADYGFIENTLADDGDALDAMVLTTFPTFPGCIITAKVIGMFIMEDEKGMDEKIMTVSEYDPRYENVNSLYDLEEHILKEYKHFFSVYKDLEEKKVDIHGWAGIEDALEVIEAAKKAYDN